jgi:hypothetical protein
MRNFMKDYRSILFVTCMAMLIATSSGCRTRIGDFSIVSTGSPQYHKMANAPVNHGVEGSDSRVWFLFLPIGGAPTLEAAVDSCMDKGKGDYIERARFYRKRWSILLFSGDGYVVKGDVGNSKAGNTGSAPAS